MRFGCKKYFAVAVFGTALGAAATGAFAGGKAPAAAAMRPLAVIDRADIAMSGLANIRELLLSRQAYNAFGLRRPLVLGAGRAAILVDGRRISDTAIDLDMLPVSAIERIEILEKGVARHGGHAIAGTVNIVLRRGFEGAEASAAAARPELKGGGAGHVGALWGGTLGRGRLTVGFDHIGRQEVRDADRDYSRARWTPGGAFAGTQGVSVGGNTILFVPADADAAVARPLGDCDESVYTGVLSHALGSGCGFAYGDVKWLDGYERRSRESLFLHAEHPIGDAADAYVDARIGQAETDFRYAPSVGTFSFTPEGDVKTRLIDGVDGLTAENFPDSGAVTVIHRFVGHGNRDWRTKYDESDVTLGVRGRISDALGYDAHARYYRHEARETGDTFVSESLARAAIENGDYDIVDPLAETERHRAAIRDTGLRLTHDTGTEYATAGAALEGAAFEIPGGAIRWIAGVEAAQEDWRDVYDYRDAGNIAHAPADVLGSAGNSVSGERRRLSVLAEASLPLLKGWDLVLAGRGDDYDDVGEAFSWRIANSYRLNDVVTLRASWSRSRTPPGLRALHAPETLDYPSVCDTTRPDCRFEQVERRSVGNPNLRPDRAERFGVGAAARLGAFSLGADWFRIGIDEEPRRLSPQSIVDLEAAGTLPAGVGVVREGGRIARLDSPYIQSGEVELTGIAIQAGAGWETDWAKLALDVRGLRTTHYRVKVAGLVQPGDYPRDRVHATLRAGRGGLAASWTVHAVSGFDNATDTGRWDSWIGHDLALRWRGALGLNGLEIVAGVLNVGNRGPSTNPAEPNAPLLRLDSVTGRTVFLNATLALGP